MNILDETKSILGVSLVVVNYNAGALLNDCITSVIKQVCEVIVVDNSSRDNSISHLSANYPDDPRLRIIQNQQNLGFAAGCNIGVEAAVSPYLLFLNPDCVLEKDAVALMLDALLSDPNAGMAGGMLMNPDGSEQEGSRRAVPTPWRSFVRAFGLYRLENRWPSLFYDFHLHKQVLPTQPVLVEAISGACMLVKQEAIIDVGSWDEDYFLHVEDLDWCMRFRQKGWDILFVPTAKIKHVKGSCGRSHPIFVEWHKHKGMIRFYHKFFKHQYPGILMWLVTAGVWLRFGGVFTVLGVQKISRHIGLMRE